LPFRLLRIKEIAFEVQFLDESFGEYFRLTDNIWAELEPGNLSVRLVDPNQKGKEKPASASGTSGKPKTFDVERKEIKDEKTGQVIETQLIIIITGRNLRVCFTAFSMSLANLGF